MPLYKLITPVPWGHLLPRFLFLATRCIPRSSQPAGLGVCERDRVTIVGYMGMAYKGDEMSLESVSVSPGKAAMYIEQSNTILQPRATTGQEYDRIRTA